MSFLNQLKSQATALQNEQSAQQTANDLSAHLTEAASKTALLYLTELVKQLNVLAPGGPKLSLNGKIPWPDMKLVDFRIDARKKRLRDKEVFDYIAMVWRLVPREGAPKAGTVSANFPPDLERIETRLSAGATDTVTCGANFLKSSSHALRRRDLGAMTKAAPPPAARRAANSSICTRVLPVPGSDASSTRGRVSMNAMDWL